MDKMLIGLAAAAFSAGPVLGAELLAQTTPHWHRSDSSPSDVRLGFQIRLAVPGAIATDYAPLGTSPYPYEGIPDDGSLGTFGSGDEGIYVIRPEDDLHFATFESLLTNGADDETAMHLFYWNTEGRMFLSPVFGGGEWTYFGTGAVGGDLEYVRLVIQNIDVAWTGATVTVDADVRWEMWGTPAPSPGTGLLLGVWSFRSRRQRR